MLLELPDGFAYEILTRTGSLMSDGNPTPSFPDGMSAFGRRDGMIALVRNHEVRENAPPIASTVSAYDSRAAGGTTTLIIDPITRQLRRDFVSLNGTLANCAGGATPWGTWISCEETTAGTASGFTAPHGYCFEVDASADAPVEAIPLRSMGRFFHEATAVDRRDGTFYLTEDQPEAGFYRFIPSTPGRLLAGGTLQMLAVEGTANFDATRIPLTGSWIRAQWVTIAQPDPANAEQDPAAVFRQGQAAGAARFRRLEGCFYGAGSVFFVSTDGGLGFGQVFEYRPSRRLRLGSGQADGWLRLLYESPAASTLEMPDNICISPRGDLFLCEDGTDHTQYLRYLRGNGVIEDFAHNIAPGFSNSEFAGCTFSPDGRTLFLNLQIAGITLAIFGPF